MFHKSDSSIKDYKGKKAKDVALRKSDRRSLRQQAGQVISALQQQQQQQLVIEKMLDLAFLQGGDLYARSMTIKQGKVTLYFRPASSTSETSISNKDTRNSKPIVHKNNDCSTLNDNDDDAVVEWPYQLDPPQCIWIQFETAPMIVYNIPSVALLATLPANSIPTVEIPFQVSKFTCRGADLMKAGMHYGLPDLTLQLKSDAALLPVVAVAVKGNPQPMAVGIVNASLINAFGNTNEDITKLGGVGVNIVSCYGDDFWRKQVPVITRARPANLIINGIGGARYCDGHYGNVGFVDGTAVVPIEQQQQEASSPETSTASNLSDTGIDNADTNAVVNAEQSDNVETLDANEQCLIVSDSDNENDQAITELTPDEILHLATCNGLAAINPPKKYLPMTVAQFYAKYVIPNRPLDTTINLKQTQWKKFGVYLQEQAKNGLVELGPDVTKKDPIAMLVNFDTRHQDLQNSIKDWKANVQTTLEDSKPRLVLVELYIIPPKIATMLKLDKAAVNADNAASPERRGTGFLTSKECRELIEDYVVKREKLIDPKNSGKVLLDGPLTDVLFAKRKNDKTAATNKKTSTTPPLHISRKSLIETWLACLEPAFGLVAMPGSRMQSLGRGTGPRVTIEVTKRNNKKFVTYVRGVEDFGIDASAFCKDVTHRFACSGTIDSEAHRRAALGKDRVELDFTGNLNQELQALLTGNESMSSHGGVKDSDYCIPASAIDVVLRKGVAKSKK